MNCTDATCPTQTACFCVLHNRLIIECVWDDRKRMRQAIEYAMRAFGPVVRTGRFSEGGEQTGNLEHCEAAMHGMSAALRGNGHPMIPS
jgi:hypothetical protein